VLAIAFSLALALALIAIISVKLIGRVGGVDVDVDDAEFCCWTVRKTGGLLVGIVLVGTVVLGGWRTGGRATEGGVDGDDDDNKGGAV